MSTTPTVPLEVLVQAMQALEGALATVPLQPLPPDVRMNIATACGSMRGYLKPILAAQKVEVTQ